MEELSDGGGGEASEGGQNGGRYGAPAEGKSLYGDHLQAGERSGPPHAVIRSSLQLPRYPSSFSAWMIWFTIGPLTLPPLPLYSMTTLMMYFGRSLLRPTMTTNQE